MKNALIPLISLGRSFLKVATDLKWNTDEKILWQLLFAPCALQYHQAYKVSCHKLVTLKITLVVCW
jgi:hypothetical protein